MTNTTANLATDTAEAAARQRRIDHDIVYGMRRTLENVYDCLSDIYDEEVCPSREAVDAGLACIEKDIDYILTRAEEMSTEAIEAERFRLYESADAGREMIGEMYDTPGSRYCPHVAARRRRVENVAKVDGRVAAGLAAILRTRVPAVAAPADDIIVLTPVRHDDQDIPF